MTRAYSESYLSNAKDRLSQFFDYGINQCGFDAGWLTSLFVITGYAEQFERGNPAILAGMSGTELLQAVVTKTYCNKTLPEPRFTERKTPEYWAGWALAEYQWYSGKRFQDIFERIPLPKILEMYSVYHEMDISAFIDTMELFYEQNTSDTKLKRIRESRGLTQAELSEASGVKLRSIQMYEQRMNDIDKAQAQTLYKMSRVLGCSVEDLLEKPMN